jgi:hypothetical protein
VLSRALAPARVAGVVLAAIACGCAATLTACGDTLQDKPIPHNTLETLLVAPYPVYWLGRSFRGRAITEVVHDPGGAFTLAYGDCVQGGQGTCVPPVRVVTSPDNSFLPGGSAPQRSATIRGAAAVIAQAGRTIVIPTAVVVVGIYALDRQLASDAAARLVPINRAAALGAPLPAPLPDTGFGAAPLPAQVPSPLRALR